MPDYPPVKEFDPFAKLITVVPWESLDGFTVSGDTGYLVYAVGSTGVMLVTGDAAANYDSRMYMKLPWYSLRVTGKLLVIDFPLTYLGALTTQNIWLRLVNEASDPPSETQDHFGWKIISGDLYASNADGSTQTITDTGVDLALWEQFTRLRMVVDPGVDIKFYVNDVLKATHTTNLPALADYLVQLQIRTLAEVIRQVGVGRMLVQKVY